MELEDFKPDARQLRFEKLYEEEEKRLIEYMWERDLPVNLAFERQWANVTLRFLAEYIVDSREGVN